jgi:archaellin
MNKLGSIGITTGILLIGLIVIAATATSVINNKNSGISEDNIEHMLDDVLNEITTYIQIKDKIGKYYTTNGQRQIEKIALLIKPLVSQNIDISDLTIKLCNGEDIKILTYSGNSRYIGSQKLFDHEIWGKITPNNFGLIVLSDRDDSLDSHNVLNKDMAYIIIQLSEDFAMRKGETMMVTLIPLSGTTITFELEAPLPMSKIVDL